MYRSQCYSLCSLLHSPLALFLLGPNIFLSTLFSKTLSLCSFLSVTDQVARPYKTTGQNNHPLAVPSRQVTFACVVIFAGMHVTTNIVFHGALLTPLILDRNVTFSCHTGMPLFGEVLTSSRLCPLVFPVSAAKASSNIYFFCFVYK